MEFMKDRVWSSVRCKDDASDLMELLSTRDNSEFRRRHLLSDVLQSLAENFEYKLDNFWSGVMAHNSNSPDTSAVYAQTP